MRVCWCQTDTRKETVICQAARLQHRPTLGYSPEIEQEHICQDPKDGELCLCREKSGETLMEARSDTDVQIVRLTWVQGRKTNRTIQQLVPSEVSLRIAGTISQLHTVKRMIRGLGIVTISTYSQTLNGCEPFVVLIEREDTMQVLSGPFLVSRTGDEGST